MARIVGNDISKWQGDVDWNIYRSNTNFCIIKASEGISYTDPKFSRNQSEGRRTNVPLGYYHFARPDLGNDPVREADWFLGVVGSFVEGEILVLDYEPGQQNQAFVVWCKSFLDRCYTRSGIRPLIYLNQSQIKSFDWSSVVAAGYGLWVAAYTYDPNNNTFNKGQWAFAAMQQWTDRQSVPGIPGVVDGNVFFGDLATFKKYGYKPPVVIDWEKKYNDEVAAHTETKRKLAEAEIKITNARIALN